MKTISRQEKQKKDYSKLIRGLRQEVKEMYYNKVQRDAYYQKLDFQEEVIIN